MRLDDVKKFAERQLKLASEFSRQISFVANAMEKRATILEHRDAVRAEVHISDDPEFESLDIGNGVGAWASIAAVDLRGSTRLADTLAPRDMYLLAHTLLPTLAHICQQSGGTVMNFRGDGLFASFGLKKHYAGDDRPEPETSEMEEANKKAVVCGLALVEATTDAVRRATLPHACHLKAAGGHYMPPAASMLTQGYRPAFSGHGSRSSDRTSAMRRKTAARTE